jgi:2-phosphosulfolactate phosphatase
VIIIVRRDFPERGSLSWSSMKSQVSYDVRFEWGPAGAAALAPSSSCLVVVDVLSFSTAVTVAAEAGTRVYPCAWRDESAAEFARSQQAQLAVGRRAVSAARPWSLSPAALRRAPFTPRLVLPSPNGSAICAAAATSEGAAAGEGTASGEGTAAGEGAREREGGATVIAGCLRNAAAVGRFLRGSPGPVTVIAAGERWPDGSLRPALEDLLGAGAILAALRDLGGLRAPGAHRGPGSGLFSPEAEAARACFEATADVAAAVGGCASGRELAESGFGDDVAVAVEVDAGRLVPVLADGAFTAAGP